MLFSLQWLRSLCAFEADADSVAAALTARGLTVDALSEVSGDHVLDVDVPANRPDCLGHLGVARELAAAFDAPLAPRPQPLQGEGDGVAASVRVEIEDAELCSRYTARLVRDVRLGPSPEWVAKRLETCGLRSINNVVDASNLVMLELGNPIHFFDLERVEGSIVRIRRAVDGETLTTLDGVERKLDADMLMIADERRAIALAGVMGGADTEIGISTQDVLIEAAWFLPASVRATSRRLGLKTDASHRFERGVDPEGVVTAQEMAVRLLVELAEGRPESGMIDAYPRPSSPAKVVLHQAQLPRLLGYDPGLEETVQSLRRLELNPERIDARSVEVTVPSWRVDLEREADLVEEVARHLGYDRIPTHTDGLPTVIASAAGDVLETRAREVLSALGFHEAFGYAMIAEDEDLAFVARTTRPAIGLSNPIAETLARLRRSILPGLLRAADLNLRRGVRDVRLFEIGHVFIPREQGGFPNESARVGLIWTGAGAARHWSRPENDVDLQDMMGLTEHLLATLRPSVCFDRTAIDLPALQPGQSVGWTGPTGQKVAWSGALHPDLQHEFGQAAFLAEIDLDLLRLTTAEVPRYSPLPKLTEVSRDLSLVLEAGTDYATILDTLRAVPAPVEVRFEVVDRYQGAPLEPGQSSLTVRATLNPSERTLRDEEIDGYRRALIEALKGQLKIDIRG
jgi:phenylalanyl-tRNA synthetase beta chain